MATFPFMVDTNLFCCAAAHCPEQLLRHSFGQLTAMLDGYLKVLWNTIFGFKHHRDKAELPIRLLQLVEFHYWKKGKMTKILKLYKTETSYIKHKTIKLYKKTETTELYRSKEVTIKLYNSVKPLTSING